MPRDAMPPRDQSFATSARMGGAQFAEESAREPLGPASMVAVRRLGMAVEWLLRRRRLAAVVSDRAERPIVRHREELREETARAKHTSGLRGHTPPSVPEHRDDAKEDADDDDAGHVFASPEEEAEQREAEDKDDDDDDGNDDNGEDDEEEEEEEEEPTGDASFSSMPPLREAPPAAAAGTERRGSLDDADDDDSGASGEQAKDHHVVQLLASDLAWSAAHHGVPPPTEAEARLRERLANCVAKGENEAVRTGFELTWERRRLGYRSSSDNTRLADAHQVAYLRLCSFLYRRARYGHTRVDDAEDDPADAVAEAGQSLSSQRAARGDAAGDDGSDADAAAANAAAAASAANGAGNAEANQALVVALHNALVSLRRAEHGEAGSLDPRRDLRGGGFVHTVDQWASALVFGGSGQERAADEKDAGAEKTAQERLTVTKGRLRCWHRLEHGVSPSTGWRRVLRVSFVLLLATSAALFAVAATWNNTSNLSLRQGMGALAAENEASAAFAVYQLGRGPLQASQMMPRLPEGAFLAAADDEDREAAWRAAVRALRHAPVDGVHFTGADGSFMGAFSDLAFSEEMAGEEERAAVPIGPDRADGAANEPLNRVVDAARVVLVRHDGSAAAPEQCSADGDAQPVSCVEAPLLNLTSPFWYTEAAGGAANRSEWTSLHATLAPSLSDASRTVLGWGADAAGGGDASRAGFTLATPVRRASDGTLLGVLGVDVRSVRLSRALTTVSVFGSAAVYVADSEWNVVASSERPASGALDVSFEAGERGAAAAVRLETHNGRVTRTAGVFRDEYPAGAAGSAEGTATSRPAFHGGLWLDWWERRRADLVSNDVLTLTANRTLEGGLELAVVVAAEESDYESRLDGPVRATYGVMLVTLVLVCLSAALGTMLIGHRPLPGDVGDDGGLDGDEDDDEAAVGAGDALPAPPPDVKYKKLWHLMKQRGQVLVFDGVTRRQMYRGLPKNGGDASAAALPPAAARTAAANAGTDDDEAGGEEKSASPLPAGPSSPPRAPRTIREDSTHVSLTGGYFPSLRRDPTLPPLQAGTVFRKILSRRDRSATLAGAASLSAEERARAAAAAQEEEAMFERARHFFFSLLVFVFVLALLAIATLWATWSGVSKAVVDDVSGEITNEAQLRISSTLMQMSETPVLSLAKAAALLAASTANFSAGAGSPEERDVDLLRALDAATRVGRSRGSLRLTREAGGVATPDWMEDTLAFSPVFRVKVGLASGEYAAAEIPASLRPGRGTPSPERVPASSFVVLARDSAFLDPDSAAPRQCLAQYATEAAAGAGATPEDGVGADLARDVASANHTAVDPGCLFDPRAEAWYADTVARNSTGWSELLSGPKSDEAGANVTRTLTLATPLRDEATGAVVGVTAVDLDLDLVDQFLANTFVLLAEDGGLGSEVDDSSASARSHFFVMKANDTVGPMVASSREDLEGEQAGTLFNAWESRSADVAATANHLVFNGSEPRISEIPGLDSVTRPRRGLQEPITGVVPLNGVLDAGESLPDAASMESLSSVVVVAVPFDGPLQQFDNRNTRSYLWCFFAVFLFVLLCFGTLGSFRRRLALRSSSRSVRDYALEAVGGDETGLEKLEAHKRNVQGVVLAACARAWAMKRRDEVGREEAAETPLRVKELREHYRRTAVEFIKASQSGRNVLTMCNLTIRGESGHFGGSSRRRAAAAAAASDGGPDDARASVFAAADTPQVEIELGRGMSTVGRADAAARGSRGSRGDAAAAAPDALELGRARAEDQPDMRPLHMYLWQSSVLHRVFINLVICVHIALYFAEPATFDEMRDRGVSTLVLALEAVLLAVELVDLAVLLLVGYRWDRADDADLSLSLAGYSNFIRRSSATVDAWYAGVVLAVLADFIGTAAANFSVEYLVPLRLFLLVLRNPPIREAASSFISTVWGARKVFLLYLWLLLVATSMGLVLFRDILNVNGPQSSYANFVRAFTTTFVFITTGENYTELVYPTFEENEAFVLYWVAFSILGLFFVLALVIGVFQQGYAELRQQKQQEDTLFRRTGTVAAFCLLDVDQGGALSRDEFVGFLRYLRPGIRAADAKRIFNKVNNRRAGDAGEAPPARAAAAAGAAAGPGDDGEEIDVLEFVQAIEGDALDWKVIRNPRSVAGSCEAARFALVLGAFERKWFSKFQLVFLMGHLAACSFYGVYDNLEILDGIMCAFVLLHAAEMSLKVWAYGAREFLNYSGYNSPRDRAEFVEMANRVDLALVSVTVMWFAVAAPAGGEFPFSNDVRVVLVIPLLRFFTVVRATRRLVYELFRILPQIGSILVLLTVVFFVYGVVGVWLLHGEFSEVLQGAAPEGNFDDIGNALLTLYQMLVGEDWHTIMYAAVKTSGGFAITGYFMSFILIVSLLFTNVFIGVVLYAFQTVLLEMGEARRRRRAERLLLHTDDLAVARSEANKKRLATEAQQGDAAAAAAAKQ